MSQWTTTYAGLVSQLKDYVEDTSAEYDSAVQGCINRAEERCLRDLDLSIFNTASTSTTSTGVATTSKGIVQSPVHNIYISSLGRHIERRSLEYIRAYGGSGAPIYFCDDTSLIHWAPVPDSAYAITITQMVRPSPLSESNTTNWLTENAADLLLWASLVESEMFLIAPERVQEFEVKYASCLGPLRAQWRDSMQTGYEPINPTPTPKQTR